MKRIILLALSFLLSFSLAFSLAACGRDYDEDREDSEDREDGEDSEDSEEVGDTPIYTREDDIIYFGSYPQIEVTDSTTKTALSAKIEGLPTSSNSNGWTSYGYYSSGNVSNYMWYIDVEDGTEEYRGVYFTSYRSYGLGFPSSSEYTYQHDNRYYTGTVYWFKYEPIAWRILSESDGTALILCDMIIDAQEYDYENGSYDNNYANSTIRAWLNETFYNTAFSKLQKEIILTTTVDNSVSSTGYSSNPYACEDTSDKIFLLSYKEVTNSAYGFSSSFSTYDEARQKKNTDYAKAQGVWSAAYGCWLLRSPRNSNSLSARIVIGSYVNYDYVYNSYYGVVPALQIRL